MKKVCPRCEYPQEGIYECEYCGLVFDQNNKTQIPKRSNGQNTIDKKSSILNIVVFFIAFIGFFGLVYLWYQHESEKKMAESEKIRKPEIGEQNITEKQQQVKVESNQQNTEENKKKVEIPAKKTQQTTPLAATNEQQNSETEKKKAVLSADDNQKTISSVNSKVFCNRFNINTILNGKDLEFWLDTDLPDNTSVMVSVSRRYWIKDSLGTYSGSYYGKSIFVYELRKPVTVILDDKQWRRQIEEKHKQIEPSGELLQLSKISDEVELKLVVPINQDNSAFGPRNLNLEGTMVTAEQGFKIIRKEKMFIVPFGKAISARTREKNLATKSSNTMRDWALSMVVAFHNTWIW
jgi:archaellum component FlaF (FlaF/FlaG flagellin family)